MRSRDDSDSSSASGEPLFRTIRARDAEIDEAHGAAAASLDLFRGYVGRVGGHLCSAKLRFRDPGLSDETGREQFLYLWLGDVRFHAEESLYSGVFFEVPSELAQWHRVGERLAFYGADVFDWMVNQDGRLFGGFTLRVQRGRIPEHEWPTFDANLGVESWAPLPSAP